MSSVVYNIDSLLMTNAFNLMIGNLHVFYNYCVLGNESPDQSTTQSKISMQHNGFGCVSSSTFNDLV